MKAKNCFIIPQFYIILLVGCSESYRQGPEKFFSNNKTKIQSIYSLYDNLNKVVPFDIFKIQGDTPAIQIVWGIGSTYEYFENGLEDPDLKNFLINKGVDEKEFFSLVNFMKEINCKYASKSLLGEENEYYLILGFDNGISLNDLQYVLCNGEKAVGYYKRAGDTKSVADKIYYQYAKAPGD